MPSVRTIETASRLTCILELHSIHARSFGLRRFTFMYPEYERRFHGASVAHVDVTKFSSASTNELTGAIHNFFNYL